MIFALAIVIISLQVSIGIVTAAEGNFRSNPIKRGIDYFTIKGWSIIFLSVAVIVCTWLMLYFTNDQKEVASDELNVQLRERDNKSQKAIDSLVAGYSSKTDSLNAKLLTSTKSNYADFINILAVYKLGLDKSNSKIIQLIKDSLEKASERPFVSIALPDNHGTPHGLSLAGMTDDSLFFATRIINAGNARADDVQIYGVYLGSSVKFGFSFLKTIDHSKFHHSLEPQVTTMTRASFKKPPAADLIIFYFIIQCKNPRGEIDKHEFIEAFDMRNMGHTNISGSYGELAKKFILDNSLLSQLKF